MSRRACYRRRLSFDHQRCDSEKPTVHGRSPCDGCRGRSVTRSDQRRDGTCCRPRDITAACYHWAQLRLPSPPPGPERLPSLPPGRESQAPLESDYRRVPSYIGSCAVIYGYLAYNYKLLSLHRNFPKNATLACTKNEQTHKAGHGVPLCNTVCLCDYVFYFALIYRRMQCRIKNLLTAILKLGDFWFWYLTLRVILFCIAYVGISE